jgi:cytochrome b561
MTEAARYTRTAVVLHWLLAAAILGQILLGWYLDEIPRGTPPRAWWVNLHKSTGLTIGLLIAFRLTWRWSHPPPVLPGSMPAWERVAADASHRLLYACMLLMPVTGYVASNFSKWGVKLYNVILLPPWGPENAQVYALLRGAHVVTSYVFVALIAVHVVGALRHVFLHDGVFQRMWPRVGVSRQGEQ